MIEPDSETEPGVRTQASLRVRTFYDEDCRAACPDWDQLSQADRKRLLASGGIPPRRDSQHKNATTVGMHEYLVQLYAARTTGELESIYNPPREVALGDSWGGTTDPDPAAFSYDDTELNNQVGTIALADPTAVGRTWSAQELIGSLELVSATIREWGVLLADGTLANHGPIDPAIVRSDSENTLLELTKPFGDVSEATDGQL